MQLVRHLSDLPFGELAQGSVVTIGSYDGLPNAWGELMSAPAIADGKPTMPCWEEYVAGPESTEDPSTWRTLLVQPIA